MAATSAARNRASHEPVRLPIPDYDRLSVKEIVPLLPSLGEQQLKELVAHEKATKNRVTLLRTFKRIELSAAPAQAAIALAPDLDVAEAQPVEAVNGVAAEPAPPARSRRSPARAKKPRKTKPTGPNQGASRRRHPSGTIRSVEPDLEERQAAAAPRTRPPAIHTSWEDEPRPVDLTWDDDDVADDDVADDDVADDGVADVLDEDGPELDEDVRELDEYDEPEDLQEAWGIDDFPDLLEEPGEARSTSKPVYEVGQPLEDMRPPKPIEVDESIEDIRPLDDVTEMRGVAPIADIRPPARTSPTAKIRPPAKIRPATRISPAKISPVRPPDAAELVIAKPLPPKPEWMVDEEPTRPVLTPVAAPKDSMIRSIRSAIGGNRDVPRVTSVLWVTAAIVAILVGILIGMLATRTTPPTAASIRQAHAVTYVAPQ